MDEHRREEWKTRLLAVDRLAALCTEYRLFCEASGVPFISADEQNLGPDSMLTISQRRWIEGFLGRWDAACELERDEAELCDLDTTPHGAA